ncbi:hypothetical protein K435DRAFT_557283, partial [Dendrothele bispora CBS 962.96]
HDTSTSNLSRHIRQCPSLKEMEKDGQLTVTQYAWGSTYNPGRLRLYQVELFAVNNRPMAIVEDKAYCKILTMLHSGVETRSETSASRDLKRVFRAHLQSLLTHTVKGVSGRVHIALDRWSSPNVISVLGVILMYIQDGRIKTITLD